MLLYGGDGDLTAVEDARGQRGVRLGVVEHRREVLHRAGAARRDNRNAHGVGHGGDEPVVVALALPVHVNAVEQNLAAAEGLHGYSELHGIHVAALAAAPDGALVPAKLLRAILEIRHPQDRLPRRIRLAVNVDAARVDGDHHGLPAVDPGDLLNGRAARAGVARGVVALRGVHSVRADAHLIRPRAEIARRHVQRGPGRVSLRVCVGANAAAHRERHEDALGCLLEHAQHGHILEHALAEAGNVQEGDLVSALVVVALRELDGLPQIAHGALGVGGFALLANVVLVALRHHEIALVVSAHVKAGDDAPRKGRGRVGDR
mmetsp:Transcript_5664/g.15837  ORF Transcript_5664/g.15837 Transcript_5664/m.15837 type:complete len:319 (-) Transcript_5664:755-1711(-)